MRRGGWLLLCGLLSASAQSGVYKYVDERGVVSYTDSYADAAPFNPEEMEYLDPDQDKVKLRYTPSGNLFIINELHGPVTVTLQFNHLEGVKSRVDLSKPIVVPARSEQFVDRLSYQGDGNLEISQQFVIGSPSQINDSELQIPFHGRFRVSQGFEGAYSHHFPGNRYAIDMPMPEGTPVLAAKSGVVLDMKMYFAGHSNDPADRARTNFIRLLHPDGTMTVYVHLRTASARVSIGQSVATGEMIAESGNTGYSSGPHLHFAVQRNNGKRLVAIPFHFNGVIPTQGSWLQN